MFTPAFLTSLPFRLAANPTRSTTPRRPSHTHYRAPPQRIQVTCTTPRDHYETLNIPTDSDPASVKRAYRRAALKNHPDVSSAPDARERFMRIQEAYSILSDVSKRRQYDRQRTQKSSGNPFEGFSGFESDGAAREYAKRWRENNPMPEDIGDSFSKIFGDVFGEVRKGLDGGGLAEDFVEFLENMTGGGGKDVAYEEDILRSGDVIVLQSELDDSMFKLEQLELNLKRVQIEDEDLRTRAGKWKERGKKAAERREVDVRDACRERAKELEERGAKVGKKVTKINDMIRKQRRWVGRVEAVLKDVRDGKEGVSKQKEQTSKPKNREEAVDDELERMRKELGL